MLLSFPIAIYKRQKQRQRKNMRNESSCEVGQSTHPSFKVTCSLPAWGKKCVCVNQASAVKPLQRCPTRALCRSAWCASPLLSFLSTDALPLPCGFPSTTPKAGCRRRWGGSSDGRWEASHPFALLYCVPPTTRPRHADNTPSHADITSTSAVYPSDRCLPAGLFSCIALPLVGGFSASFLA